MRLQQTGKLLIQYGIPVGVVPGPAYRSALGCQGQTAERVIQGEAQFLQSRRQADIFRQSQRVWVAIHDEQYCPGCAKEQRQEFAQAFAKRFQRNWSRQ